MQTIKGEKNFGIEVFYLLIDRINIKDMSDEDIDLANRAVTLLEQISRKYKRSKANED